MNELLKISILSDPAEIRKVREGVEAFSRGEGFARCDAEKIGLAINEALANVIEHGYKGDEGKPIDIEMEIVESEGIRNLKVVVRDYGRHVVIESIKGRDLEDVRPGGLGVHIIKTIMDSVDYRCMPEGGMCLTMLKSIETTEESEE